MAVLAEKPHRAGTEANAKALENVGLWLGGMGLRVEKEGFIADLPEPLPSRIALVDEQGGERDLDYFERPVPGDRYSEAAPNQPPFFAFAPDADVTAPVVYANFGEEADYAELEKAGVAVAGKIVLARSQGVCRGMKGVVAERKGVKALLLFPEPHDQGFKKPPFPTGPNLNPWTAQRGSMLRYFESPGDPRAAREAGVSNLPTVPALPVNEVVAEELLRAIEGAPVPEAWKGWLPVPYRLGESRARVRLVTRSRVTSRRLTNVLATLEGSDPGLPSLIVGAHVDAWVHGAVDPCSGAATVLEAAEALSRLRREGKWRPVRSVVFAFFDGEEYGIFGSAAWVRRRLPDLSRSVSTFLYVDSAVRAHDFMGNVVPGLEGVLDAALARVQDPVSGLRSLESARGSFNVPGFSGDTAPFLGFSPVPSLEIGFGRSYALYHSLYDDMEWVRRFADPGFTFSATLAKVVALTVVQLADGPLLPFRYAELPRRERQLLKTLRADAKDPAFARGPLGRLEGELDRFEETARLFDDAARGARPAKETLARVDAALRLVWNAFRAGEGFGHNDLLLGPGELNPCAGEQLPRLQHVFRAKDAAALEAEVQRLCSAFQEARGHLEEARRAL